VNNSIYLSYHVGVAIDIGGHMGDSTIPIAMQYNHTIAFDPSNDVHKLLEVNNILNKHLNIDVYNL
jgi:FkbM family methyltransferase